MNRARGARSISRLTHFVSLSLAACGMVLAIAVGASAPVNAQVSETELLDTGNRLAALLRAGRSVVSANQSTINDADIGDKGLGPDVFIAKVTAAYEKATGESPLTDGLTDRQIELTKAQLAAMRQVVAEAQPLINKQGEGFKGFIPAVFARLTNEKFAEMVGDKAHVKVTAPPDLVRNRKARPDAWEADAIASKLGTDDWTKGTPYYELLSVADGGQFRMIIPEYYVPSCLSCHGEPKSEVDITGFPKEGGKDGELGGAISITLTQ